MPGRQRRLAVALAHLDIRRSETAIAVRRLPAEQPMMNFWNGSSSNGLPSSSPSAGRRRKPEEADRPLGSLGVRRRPRALPSTRSGNGASHASRTNRPAMIRPATTSARNAQPGIAALPRRNSSKGSASVSPVLPFNFDRLDGSRPDGDAKTRTACQAERCWATAGCGITYPGLESDVPTFFLQRLCRLLELGPCLAIGGKRISIHDGDQSSRSSSGTSARHFVFAVASSQVGHEDAPAAGRGSLLCTHTFPGSPLSTFSLVGCGSGPRFPMPTPYPKTCGRAFLAATTVSGRQAPRYFDRPRPCTAAMGHLLGRGHMGPSRDGTLHMRPAIRRCVAGGPPG